MATINSLTELTDFTKHPNVVIEDDTGNFKTPLPMSGTYIKSTEYPASDDIKAVIQSALDLVISKYGLKGGHYNFMSAWSNHPNGVMLAIEAVYGYGNTYCAFYGTAITQTSGVYAFTDFYTIATGTSGTLRVGKISDATLA